MSEHYVRVSGANMGSFLTDSRFSDLISIFYCVAALLTLKQLVQQWQPFWDNRVTRSDRDLSIRVAFLIFVPIGVLLHELGHALAVWGLGENVAEFHWGVFWGYVRPERVFTEPEIWWWIALSGNLVSIVLGLCAISLIRLARKRILKVLLANFARVQLVYALVIYPLFSLAYRFGDWVMIYNFSAQPYATLTLIGHVALLFGLRRFMKWNRRRPKSYRSRKVTNPHD